MSKTEIPSIRFRGFDNDWEQRKFDEAFIERRNKTEKENEDILLSCAINGMFLNSELFGHFRGTTTIGYLRVKKNDLILSAQNLHLGNANVNLRFEHGIISPAYKVYDLNNCNPEFVQSWVKRDDTKKFFLAATTEGASQCRKNIEWETLGKQTISMPSLDEQKRVGSFFSQLDNLITLHQRKFEKLTNVKKSMLEKMFPRNGSCYPEIRFKGFTDPWEQRKFEEIAVRSSVICSDDTLPRVEYEDIVSGTGRLNKDIYAKQSSKSGIVFHQGDVLYGKLRPYLQNWLLPTFDGLAVGDFWVLQPQNADSSFLYRLIQSRQFDEVANQSTGTKMPRADWKLVSKTVFSIPSNISEQAAIGTYFTALDSLITLHQRELEKLQNIKKSLLEKMFV